MMVVSMPPMKLDMRASATRFPHGRPASRSPSKGSQFEALAFMALGGTRERKQIAKYIERTTMTTSAQIPAAPGLEKRRFVSSLMTTDVSHPEYQNIEINSPATRPLVPPAPERLNQLRLGVATPCR